MRRLALLAVLCSAGAQAQSIEPGEWEFVTENVTPGLPRAQPSAARLCLDKAQAKDPMYWNHGARLPADCRITTQRLGPRAAWEMECPSSGLRGAGEATLSSGSLQSELRLSGGIRAQTRGRRLGPCKP